MSPHRAHDAYLRVAAEGKDEHDRQADDDYVYAPEPGILVGVVQHALHYALLCAAQRASNERKKQYSPPANDYPS